jgi:hypothetical protein
VDVDGLGRSEPVRLPHLAEHVLAADDGAGIGGEQCEEVELLRCQLQVAPGERDAPRADVDLERSRDELGVPHPALRAAEDRADPREQLAEAERLHDVVVRPELETDDAVDLLPLRRHDDDRHL